MVIAAAAEKNEKIGNRHAITDLSRTQVKLNRFG